MASRAIADNADNEGRHRDSVSGMSDETTECRKSVLTSTHSSSNSSASLYLDYFFDHPQ